ncbi:MAG TPA: hypothetical protein DEO32_01180 [Ruminococcaceae bacterium]|nr:hypothetical protein [Oscillospiraceae bacterium]
MFGYLQIQKNELLVREYEAYKSVYCGLCKQMGKDYSFLTRLTLSYDCTFYAMLLMSLHRSCSGFDNGRCRFNPLKKCGYSRCADDSLSKASAFSVISAYYKLIDDINDSKFFKRIIYIMIKPFFSHWHKKAAKNYPQLEAYVSDMMQAQQKAEQNSAGIDEAAHPTAEMLSRVLCLEAKTESQNLVYSELGYHIGRWIYLIDAADDYEKDKKSGSFNPFLNADEDNLKNVMTVTLNQCLARAYNAYQLIDIIDYKGILDNMMLYGFPAKQNLVIFGNQEEVNDKSV